MSGSVIQHAVLPVLTYALYGYGSWLLTMRRASSRCSATISSWPPSCEACQQQTRMRYVSRNAILPMFTVFAISIGYLRRRLGAVEDVFDYPGLGNVLLQAIGSRDYPLMCGAFLLSRSRSCGEHHRRPLLHRDRPAE